MILEKNNLQTAQEWTKSYIELIASYVHPKTGNHLRSHLRAIMALDHRRLIRHGKKIKPNFLRSTSLLYKILPTNLGACKPTQYFLYITSEVKRYYEALFLSYRPRTECSSSQFCNTNCTHLIFRTMDAKPLKKFPKSPITASRFSLLTSAKFAVRAECLNEH